MSDNTQKQFLDKDGLNSLWSKICTTIDENTPFAPGEGEYSAVLKGDGEPSGPTTATGKYAVAEGNGTIASGLASHAEGYDTEANGDYSHAEGYGAIAEGTASHAEGSASHAEGIGSHAEGIDTIATGEASHAEGYGALAEGSASHAEGAGTIASGMHSHAGGFGARVAGKSSFGHGDYVKTTHDYETAFGKYNKSNTDTLFSVGNGTDDDESNRKNAFEVKTDNTAYVNDKKIAVVNDINDIKYFSTKRDFENGTLIKTDIDYSKTNGDPFYIEIKGNTYFSYGSMFIQAQGYIYEDHIIHYSITSLGVIYPSEFIAINVDGFLCFWFPRIDYWHGYSIKVTTGYDYNINRVVDVIDSVEPTGTKRVVMSNNYFINKGFNRTLKTTTLKYRDSDNQVVNAPIDPTYESLIDITGGLYYARTAATATRVSNELTIHTADGDVYYDGSSKQEITIPAGGSGADLNHTHDVAVSGTIDLQASWSNGVLTLNPVFIGNTVTSSYGSTNKLPGGSVAGSTSSATTTTTTTTSSTTTTTTTTPAPVKTKIYTIEGTFSNIIYRPIMWTQDYYGSALLLQDDDLIVKYYKSDGVEITGLEPLAQPVKSYKITTTFDPTPAGIATNLSKYLMVSGNVGLLNGSASIGGKLSIVPLTNITKWTTTEYTDSIVYSTTLDFGSTILTTIESGLNPSLPTKGPGEEEPPAQGSILCRYALSFSTIGTTVPSTAILMAKLYNSKGMEIATTPVAFTTSGSTTTGSVVWTINTDTAPGALLSVMLYTSDYSMDSGKQSVNFTLQSSSDGTYYYRCDDVVFSMFVVSNPNQTTPEPYSLTNPDVGAESNNDDNDDTSSLDDVINEYMNEQ